MTTFIVVKKKHGIFNFLIFLFGVLAWRERILEIRIKNSVEIVNRKKEFAENCVNSFHLAASASWQT
jgi:hypothetical protein